MKLLGLVYTLLSVCISFSSYATAVDSILKVNKSKSKKETIEALVSKAQLFYDKGKNGNACECLKAADSLSVQNEEILAPTILSHAVFCDFKNAMALPMLALHRSFNSLDASADNNALIKLSVFIGYRYLAAGEPDSFLIFNNKAESLINNNTPVSLKYLQVYYLGRAALHHEIYATADSAFNAAIHFATEMKDSSKLSQCWAKLGRSFDEQGNSFRADSFLKLSASYFKSKKDLQNLAHTYSQLSSVSIRIGQTETAIEYAFKALEIYKKNNYNKGISSEYVNIGRIYAQMKELDLALENYKQSLEYTKGSINPTASLSALSNIGATYVELGQPKQGLPYMLKAYKIEEELQLNSSLAMSCYNLSQAYDALNNTDSSLFYLSKCRDILEPTGDLMRLAAVNQGIGSIYLRQNKFKEACNYCLQAEEMAIKSNLVDVLDEVYNCLYVGNKALGNYQMALDYKEKYHVVQDSIRSVQNERKMAQLEAKQEFATIQLADSLNNAKIQAEKDAQIAVEQEKVKQQKTISYASVTGGVLLLLLAGSIYYSKRKTQKQNQEISAQKSAIEKRNTQIE
ncbi:MAG: tetratricopeptide repeat protein, partial [Bacteroidetes bacterium]|nr:tetratricopeptide repeat protein [Bacteroidota bacterium]